MKRKKPSDTPHVVLVRSLRTRWSAEDASVLADWCEEHGLHLAAKELRKEPSAGVRAMIDALGMVLTGLSRSTITYWQLNWLEGFEDTPEVRKKLGLPRKRYL